MSRIRQIKPSWFLDKELRRGTTADVREFYIGLWMIADDEGWLKWDADRIGAELYPYEPFIRRERNVERWGDVLMGLNAERAHLVLYDCGHGFLPHMKQHQRIAGTRAEANAKEHRDVCRDVRRRLRLHVATGSPGKGKGRVGNGKERNVEGGTVDAPDEARDSDDGETTEFRRLTGWRA